MNNIELRKIKKNFKLDNEGAFEVIEMVSSYCKSDSKGMNLVFTESSYFETIDDDLKENYYKTFKKLLTGSFGTKLFELDIENTVEGYESQKLLCKLLDENNFETISDDLIQNIISNIDYQTDILVTVMLGQSIINYDEKHRSGTDNYHKFILCFINKLEVSDKEILIDTTKHGLSIKNSDVIVNLKKPVEGFMFPSITDCKSDVNKVLYASGTANRIHEKLTQGVLHCSKVLTAKQEKSIFETVLKETVGNNIALNTISNIITNIAEENINNETGTITTKRLGEILETNGIEDANSALLGIVPNLDDEVKVENLISFAKKGIKFNNSDITVAIDVNNLNKISQTNKDGKKCLVIELSDNVKLDDFKII